MQGKPLVSVTMPVWNAERYVGEAIESVLAQTLEDFELLVVDDGSTDRSLERLRGYASKDPRIRLTSRENRGLVATLNELVAASRGVFVARMDSDDVCLPERFALQVAFLERRPDVVCVGGAFELIDGQGRLLTRLRPPAADAEMQRLALAGHNSAPHPSLMIRREALVAAGGYDPELFLAEDLDLVLRLGEVGRLANLEEVVLRYRVHPGSVSGRHAGLQRERARQACERAWRRRGIEGRFEAEGAWRPGSDRISRHAFLCRYGWWAFGSGQRRTALVYAIRAVAARPLSPAGWRLLACALLKPMPRARSGGRA